MSFLLPMSKKRSWGKELSLSSSSSSASSSSSFSLFSAADGIDRLTSLPDTLRLHILTFLPLKSAIRTSVLSSLWRDLWKLRWPHPSSLSLSSSSLSSDDFVRQVDLLIILLLLPPGGAHRRHDSLHISFPSSPRHISDLRRWLDYAAATGVEDLSIDLSPPSATVRRYPRALYFHFTSSDDYPSLYRLTLCNLLLVIPPSPHFKKLSSLEVLNLSAVHITDFALERIIANCPLLKTLDIRRCPKLERMAVPVTGIRLSNIIIIDCPKVLEIIIASPNLRRFHFSGKFVSKYSLDHVLALKDVYMSCGGPETGLPRSNWVEAFRELCHLRVLTLCSLSLQYIAVEGANPIGEFQNFRKLRELQLLMMTMTGSNLMDIYSFFRLCCCPALEKLFIELPTHMHDPYMENFLEGTEEEPPQGVFTNLKMIKINNFKGHRYEMQLVRFLLWKAICLETLIIVVPQEDMGGVESSMSVVDCRSHMLHFLHMQLSLMEKLSANAQIVVSEHDDYRVRPTHFDVQYKV